MKPLVTISCLFATVIFGISAPPNNPATLNIGSYVTLAPGQAGFLKYFGKHKGITVYGLSHDIGSAVPCEDFCLYARIKDKYISILSLPMAEQRGFRCICTEDRLNIYMTKTLEENLDFAFKPKDEELFLSVDLLKLLQKYAEPGAPEQPPPADSLK